jgi:RNA recognition motif-containing protein
MNSIDTNIITHEKHSISTNGNMYINNKNLLIIKNIKNMTREDVYEFFSNFGTVGKHFIVTDHDTGLSKNYAIVEIIEKDVYDALLNLKEITYQEYSLDIIKWKANKPIKNKTITKNDLYNAFVAGKHFGFLESIKKDKMCMVQNKNQ